MIPRVLKRYAPLILLAVVLMIFTTTISYNPITGKVVADTETRVIPMKLLIIALIFLITISLTLTIAIMWPSKKVEAVEEVEEPTTERLDRIRAYKEELEGIRSLTPHAVRRTPSAAPVAKPEGNTRPHA